MLITGAVSVSKYLSLPLETTRHKHKLCTTVWKYTVFWRFLNHLLVKSDLDFTLSVTDNKLKLSPLSTACIIHEHVTTWSWHQPWFHNHWQISSLLLIPQYCYFVHPVMVKKKMTPNAELGRILKSYLEIHQVKNVWISKLMYIFENFF